MRSEDRGLGRHCPCVRRTLSNKNNIRINIEYRVNDKVWRIRFDDTRGSWGADDMGEIHTLSAVGCVTGQRQNGAARTTRCAEIAAKNGAPV